MIAAACSLHSSRMVEMCVQGTANHNGSPVGSSTGLCAQGIDLAMLAVGHCIYVGGGGRDYDLLLSHVEWFSGASSNAGGNTGGPCHLTQSC